MPGTKLEPARHLLSNLTFDELETIARRARLPRPWPRSRARLTELLTLHLTLDDLVDRMARLYPRARPATAGFEYLDRLPPLHGPALIRAVSRSRTAGGRLLLERDRGGLGLALSNVTLFLENRFPVLARDAGSVAARGGIVDEGEYQLRNARLRLELGRAGPVSFLMTFLRLRGRRPEYLLEPIA